ncbi:MAG: hypothetical protein NUW37_18855 [Planctomycetes bacterium]|nr:hypothetical protein [Planctomycetota bacterium]
MRGNPAKLVSSIFYIYGISGLAHDKLLEIARDTISETGGNVVTTTYEKIFRKGMKEGKIEGKLEGMHEMLLFSIEAKLGKPDKKLKNTVQGLVEGGQIEFVKASVKIAKNLEELIDLLSKL